ncbi:hypothetical protein [Stenotrophomonas sp. S41]|uniref:hypothetical protein n=1 Tax=Stenotrophomonas sp. S41 TaxID=2767464 RepID=UPI00190A9E40|nr:hypothetical protein [Stenotrophomonas sp. S41]MBK0013502.1 hypothetical protein [Stenotrophomonas sp. S41]
MDLLENREELSAKELYDHYYLHSGLDREVVKELLIHVAGELRLPSGKIRPSDRFSKELVSGASAGWDSGYGILLYELQSLAKSRGVAIDKKVDTIDDYIRIMADIY